MIRLKLHTVLKSAAKISGHFFVFLTGLLAVCFLHLCFRNQLESSKEFIDRIWGSFSLDLSFPEIFFYFPVVLPIIKLIFKILFYRSFSCYTGLTFDCPQNASSKKTFNSTDACPLIRESITFQNLLFFYSPEFIVISGRFFPLGVYSAIQEVGLSLLLSSMKEERGKLEDKENAIYKALIMRIGERYHPQVPLLGFLRQKLRLMSKCKGA